MKITKLDIVIYIGESVEKITNWTAERVFHEAAEGNGILTDMKPTEIEVKSIEELPDGTEEIFSDLFDEE
jgi:hypothetical protein